MELRSKFVLLFALLCSGSMWFYVRRILVPFQVADSAVRDRPRGILSDLYPRWLGARELLLHHRDPYSAEVTRDIQAGYYGRTLDPSRPGDPKDQQAFAYPVYVVFLLAPSIGLPFSVIESVFHWLLIALTLASLWAWLRILHWRVNTPIGLALAALTLGNFPVVQGVLLEQLTLVVFALFTACLGLIAGGRLAAGGCLLAVATVKPQLAWPIVLWLFFWALSDWQKRQNFLWGFGLTAIILEAASEFILPGWIAKFFAGMKAYQQYTGAQSIFSYLSGSTGGTIINSAVILLVALLCWKARAVRSESAQFSLVSAVILAATVVVVPSTAPYNQILLLPAVLVLLKNCHVLWENNLLTRGVTLVVGAFAVWPWLASLGLMAASAFAPAASVQRAWVLPLFSSLAIPPSILLLNLVYIRQPTLHKL